MSEQRAPQGEQATTQPAATGNDDVDLRALTAAVERLFRRDLEIARERLFAAQRT